MTNSIPASALVNVTPGVLGAGGNPLSLNGVFLTGDGSIPIDVVQPFFTAQDVADWFGANSVEAALASIYFAGYNNATQVPGTLYFVQNNTGAVAAYVRGGDLSSLTLTALQALSGLLTVTINGDAVTSAAIDLSGATSFSNAAAVIQSGLQTPGGIFSGTAVQTASANVLQVTAVGSGTLHIGDVISGTGVDAGLTILTQVDGTTGGVGHYTVSTTTGFSSTTIHVTSAATVTYDALRHAFVIHSPTTGDDSTIGFVSNTLSAGIKLTSATGAVLSQGSAARTPAEVMDSVVAATQNWATFMTIDEPILSVKLAFAAWVNGQNQRYAYVCADSDAAPTTDPDATGSFGRLTGTDNGVVAIYDLDRTIAAFFCGAAAAINFNQTNGRISFAYKGQAGLVPDVTTLSVSENLIANGYNFYGSYATANDQFQLFQNGQISGDWLWADAYINQIKFNSDLQLALLELLANIPSVPYNPRGFGLLRAAVLPTINAFANFGGLQPGVTLSASQIAEVNNAAGFNIAGTLQQSGWYLQIKDPGAIVRAARGSPDMTLWYVDGGSVQSISLASIDVQ